MINFINWVVRLLSLSLLRSASRAHLISFSVAAWPPPIVIRSTTTTNAGKSWLGLDAAFIMIIIVVVVFNGSASHTPRLQYMFIQAYIHCSSGHNVLFTSHGYMHFGK